MPGGSVHLMPRRTSLLLGSFYVWTLFVWVGRIRNALTDDALEGWDRNGPLLLALSFVVPALVLAVVLVRHAAGSAARAPGRLLTQGTIALVAWTTAVWVVRAGDIALGRDHEAAFVVVHLVLAVVSISLGVLAARAVLGATTDVPRRATSSSATRPS
jgi:hypothetical protein